MSPDEHYEAAEKHLDWARTVGQHGPIEKYHLDAAQVHATLALAGYQAAANERAADQANHVREFVRGAMGDYHPVIRTVTS